MYEEKFSDRLSQLRIFRCTPCEFFNFDSENPKELDIAYSNLVKLSATQQKNISEIIQDLIKNK